MSEDAEGAKPDRQKLALQVKNESRMLNALCLKLGGEAAHVRLFSDATVSCIMLIQITFKLYNVSVIRYALYISLSHE